MVTKKQGLWRLMQAMAPTIIALSLIIAPMAPPAHAQQVAGSSEWNPGYGTHKYATFWVTGEVKGTPASYKVEAQFQKKYLFWWRTVETEVLYSPIMAPYWYYDTINSTFVARGSGTYRMTQTLYVRYHELWYALASNSSQSYRHL